MPVQAAMEAPLPELLGAAITWVVFPAWMAAGFADWLCHRHAGIAVTSGLRESLLHWLMLAEMGLPTLVALLCEINALVLLLLAGGFALHQLTVYVDLRYSSARRDIPPVEQMVHSGLELIPVIGGVLLALLHWPAVLSLLPGGAAPDFALRPKQEPLPLETWLFGGGALALLVLLPMAAELRECWRARRPVSGH